MLLRILGNWQTSACGACALAAMGVGAWNTGVLLGALLIAQGFLATGLLLAADARKQRKP